MVHRVNGAAFIALFLVPSGLCVKVVIDAGTDLGPRAALHSLIGGCLFRTPRVQGGGRTALPGFLREASRRRLVAFRADFSPDLQLCRLLFLVSDLALEGSAAKPKVVAGKQAGPEVGSVAEGQVLFRTKCASCHYAESEKKLTGPGLKGVLKNPGLPSSKKPATSETGARADRAPLHAHAFVLKPP